MRIGAIAFVRLIVMLRRIWKSIDRLADIEQSRYRLEKDRLILDYPKWKQAAGRSIAEVRKIKIDHVEVDDLNKQYREQHPED